MNLCPADLVPLWKMEGSTFYHPVWAGDFLHFVYYQYEFFISCNRALYTSFQCCSRFLSSKEIFYLLLTKSFIFSLQLDLICTVSWKYLQGKSSFETYHDLHL